MIKRCKHQNGELIEFVEAAHVRQISNGVLSLAGSNEIGNIIGYEYHCTDCDKYFRYSAYIAIGPVWLRKIHEQLLDKPGDLFLLESQ